MTGPPRKPADESHRRNRQAIKLVRPEMPAAEEGLLPETVEAWRLFWMSETAKYIDIETDINAIRRLFWNYDELERLKALYREERITTGSTGQAKPSPLWSIIKDTQNLILQLEDRIGMTARARMQLGIKFTEAMRNLEELNRRLQDGKQEDTDDPRLKVQA